MRIPREKIGEPFSLSKEIGHPIADEHISEPRNDRIVVSRIESLGNNSKRNEEDGIHMNSAYPFTQNDDEDTNGDAISTKWEGYQHEDRGKCKEVKNPKIYTLLRKIHIRHERDHEGYDRECEASSE